MSWLRHTYTDKLTRRIVAVEVEPAADLKPHRSEEDCECVPVCKEVNGVAMLIHNAFDGREFSEPNHQEKGH